MWGVCLLSPLLSNLHIGSFGGRHASEFGTSFSALLRPLQNLYAVPNKEVLPLKQSATNEVFNVNFPVATPKLPPAIYAEREYAQRRTAYCAAPAMGNRIGTMRDTKVFRHIAKVAAIFYVLIAAKNIECGFACHPRNFDVVVNMVDGDEEVKDVIDFKAGSQPRLLTLCLFKHVPRGV